MKVVVTGAAGQISYSLIPFLCENGIFKSNEKIDFSLVEIPSAMEKLSGFVKELEDSAYSNINSISVHDNINSAVEDADWCLLVGSIPRGIVLNGKEIKERADLLKINGGIFTEQGKAIGENGNPDAKVLVVGNPANTNALIGMTHAKNDSQTWMAMTALDANRAKAQVSSKLNISISEISQMIIWGNHSPTMYPDLDNAKVGEEKVSSLIKDKHWIEKDFIETVQQRGKAIIDARGASSAASAANAAIETVIASSTPTKEGDCFSAAILSDGSYKVPEGIIYGFPLKTKEDGKIEIIKNLELNSYAIKKLEITTKELLEEKEAVRELI